MSRRRNKGGGGGHDGGDERWLLTYADMITLLLALFVILFAMSTVDPVRYESLRQTLSEEFTGSINTGSDSILDAAENSFPSDAAQIKAQSKKLEEVDARDKEKQAERQQLQSSKQQVEQVASESISKGKIEALTSERGVVIRIQGDALFAPGSAVIRPEARKELTKIAKVLAANKRKIGVDGHTDGQPISSAQYPSNWELSSARSASVVALLLGNGVKPARVQGRYFADTKPIVKPKKAKQAMPQNRRVEITVLTNDAARKEFGEDTSSAVGAAGIPTNPAPAPEAEEDITPYIVPVPDIVGPIVDIGES